MHQRARAYVSYTLLSNLPDGNVSLVSNIHISSVINSKTLWLIKNSRAQIAICVPIVAISTRKPLYHTSYIVKNPQKRTLKAQFSTLFSSIRHLVYQIYQKYELERDQDETLNFNRTGISSYFDQVKTHKNKHLNHSFLFLYLFFIFSNQINVKFITRFTKN